METQKDLNSVGQQRLDQNYCSFKQRQYHEIKTQKRIINSCLKIPKAGNKRTMPVTKLNSSGSLNIQVTSDSLESLFKDSLLYVMKTLHPGRATTQIIEREVQLTSINPTTLLIDFLNEILSLTHVYHEIYSDVEIIEFTGKGIRIKLKGAGIETFDRDIKGLTYYDPRIIRSESGSWVTKLTVEM